MLEFGFSIILNDPAEQELVKAFVKEYYSCFDFINENVDSSSRKRSVCAECLGIDSSDLSFVRDSLYTGDFAKRLIIQGFNIKLLSMSIQEIGFAAATITDGKIDYRAIPYYDDCDPAVHMTGSGNDGFLIEDLPYSTDLYDEIDNLCSYIIGESLR